MKIKDYKCKCGNDDFFFVENGNQMGIYCTYCGKWNKWADKDERNLSMRKEQKTGKWIEQDDGWDGIYYECSSCGEAFVLIDGTPKDNLYHYCPNCGARMVGEEE